MADACQHNDPGTCGLCLEACCVICHDCTDLTGRLTRAINATLATAAA